jgi:hypothetical protein
MRNNKASVAGNYRGLTPPPNRYKGRSKASLSVLKKTKAASTQACRLDENYRQREDQAYK